MGIHNLSKLIADVAPSSIVENDFKNYFGRKVAIDASMCIYQFLVAVRTDGNYLMSADGETTSHINGIFYRTIRMLENGIKPVYVFDGKPPTMKSGELEKRAERRDEAMKSLAIAEEQGDQESVDKFSRRLVKASKQHNDECKELLGLMGIPVIEAPCEAEAQCAALVAQGLVYATATEDMDTLSFGCPVLLRQLLASEARKLPVREFHLERVLACTGFTQTQFVDLCILLGCDYCDTIRGIGPKRAFELMQKHGSIDAILEHLDHSKYAVPEDWPYEVARRLFLEPDVMCVDDIQLKWRQPDEEAVIAFMCGSRAFSEERVRSAIARLTKARSRGTQARLDGFFKPLTVSTAAVKRPIEEKSKKGAKKSKTVVTKRKRK